MSHQNNADLVRTPFLGIDLLFKVILLLKFIYSLFGTYSRDWSYMVS